MPTLTYLKNMLITEDEYYTKDFNAWISFREKMIEDINRIDYATISCQKKQIDQSCLTTSFFGRIFKSYFIYKPNSPSLIKYLEKNKNSEWEDLCGCIEINEGSFKIKNTTGETYSYKVENEMVIGEHIKILMEAIGIFCRKRVVERR